MAKRKKKVSRRTFTSEYKAEVVALVRQSDEPLSQVCRNLDLTDSMVRRWLKEDQGMATTSESDSGVESDSDELKRLRREVKQLRQEREILKKAAAFFAKEST
jgi:transposase